MGRRSKASPSQGRWLGEAGTERLQQICGDLSVSLRLTAPLQGEPLVRRILVSSPIMRINSRNRKKDDKRRKKRESKV